MGYSSKVQSREDTGKETNPVKPTTYFRKGTATRGAEKGTITTTIKYTDTTKKGCIPPEVAESIPDTSVEISKTKRDIKDERANILI
jgi:hypothetical protein